MHDVANGIRSVSCDSDPSREDILSPVERYYTETRSSIAYAVGRACTRSRDHRYFAYASISELSWLSSKADRAVTARGVCENTRDRTPSIASLSPWEMTRENPQGNLHYCGAVSAGCR